MQLEVEKTVSRFPEVAFVFSKTGTAEIATDPMPPNVSDTFIILKPREAVAGSATDRRTSWSSEIEEAVEQLPGNAYEFTQPIQMRFNELIAGVRGDIAVKVYGDEFEPMLRAANQIAAHPARRARRGRREGRAGRGPAGAGDQGRQGGDRAARPERRRRCRT